jgi:hypothetical protein
MKLTPRNFVLLLFAAGAAASVDLAPIAAAQTPEAGSEDAAATISDLKSQGYTVRINWVSGSPDIPLSECSVTGIDTAAAPTAWVNVECDEAGD